MKSMMGLLRCWGLNLAVTGCAGSKAVPRAGTFGEVHMRDNYTGKCWLQYHTCLVLPVLTQYALRTHKCLHVMMQTYMKTSSHSYSL